MEMVKFTVTLWSHHHNKQSMSQTLLALSILYTVEIRQIVPCPRGKVVIANQDHMCDFVITLLSQLHMITEVNRM